MLKFLSRLGVLLLVALLAITPALAQSDIYEDPNGLFTVPIPTNWTVEQLDGYAVMSDPDGAISVYLLTVEADSIDDGVDAAWELIDPDFDLEVAQSQEPPSSDGVSDTAIITYATDFEVEIVQAVAQLSDGVVYLIIFDGDTTALQQRNSQIQIIAGGFAITALEHDDLSEVEALPIDDEIIGELEAYIADIMESFDTAGLSVAIVQDGEVIYSNGFGVTESGGDQPVTASTMMMIGSTTKSMTTMMMATLVDDGLMEWDTPVVDILPTFALSDADVTQQITVRNMVCACTGVPRRDYEWVFNMFSPQGIIDSLSTYQLFTDFGEAFQYSNQMVATGGYVATLAAGGSYNNLYNDYLTTMQARVFDPIGMTSSTFSFEDVIAGDNYALPHGLNVDGDYVPMSVDVERILSPMAPAGALWSNAEDMALYAITELNEGEASNGTRVVSAENLGVTWEPQVAVSADASYGLGWIIGDYYGVQVIEHGGNTLGFSSELAFLPDVGIGISVLTNQQGSPVNAAVRYRLLELIYGREAEYDQQLTAAIENSQAPGVEFVAPDADAVEGFAGRYHNADLGEVFVSVVDGQMWFNAGEFITELRLQTGAGDEEDTYVTFDPPLAGLPVYFREDDDGAPIMVIGFGVVEYTFTKVE